MLSDYVRERARALLDAVARIFVSLGVSPNTLTVIGFGAVLLIAVVIGLGYEALGGALIILAAAFDAVDGTLARMTGKASKFGAFLDSTLDRWADAALLLAVIYRATVWADALTNSTIYLAVIALIGSLLVSYTRARAEGLGARVKEGWFTRFERTVVLIAGLILTSLFGPISLTVAVGVLAVFANVTAIQRVFAARAALQ